LDEVLRGLARDGVPFRGFVKPMRESRPGGDRSSTEEVPLVAHSPGHPSPEQPIYSKEELLEYFLRGAKPAMTWGVGMEYERLGLDARNGSAIPYFGPRGVEVVLRALADRFGWEEYCENGHVIGLKRDGSAITLEPGGQLELSSGIHRDLCSLRQEVAQHFRETAAVSDPLDLRWVPIGLHPVTPIGRSTGSPRSATRSSRPFSRPAAPSRST
jgi:glutamate--cysteine ligase